MEQQPQMNVNIDLKNTEAVEHKNGKVWAQGFLIRKVSKFVTGTSEDAYMPIPVFYDPTTGTQIDASLKFAYVGAVSSNTSTVSFIKLRAAAGAGDGVANTDGVLPLLASYSVDSQALASSNITSIAYKKAASGDSFILYCGFNRG